MADKRINNLKLGIFTLAGILFLVITLYMIGRDQNLFGSNIIIKAQFRNAQGVVPGNNVRYSGIQIGTVSSVNLINDTLIEINMLIDEKSSSKILSNALAAIGTEGLIGNKIINLFPGEGTGTPIREGDILKAKKTTDTDAILETLSITNQNAAVLSAELVQTVNRINKSTALWKILNDDTLASNLKASLLNIRQASEKTNHLVGELNGLVADVKNGEGTAGRLLYDTALAVQLSAALAKLDEAANNASSLTGKLDGLLTGIQQDLETGKGPANAILKDSSMVNKLQNSLTNIEKSTFAFNENMEALKHNFLFRGYFRKQQKKQVKDSVNSLKTP